MSYQYAPTELIEWPSKSGPYNVRVDLDNIRGTTIYCLKRALEMPDIRGYSDSGSPLLLNVKWNTSWRVNAGYINEKLLWQIPRSYERCTLELLGLLE